MRNSKRYGSSVAATNVRSVESTGGTVSMKTAWTLIRDTSPDVAVLSL